MNVRSGDLAGVVQAGISDSLGLIVQVLRPHVDMPEWDFRGQSTWWCGCAQSMQGFFGSANRTVQANEGPVPDRCLRPIRPGKPRKSSVARKLRTAPKPALLRETT